MVAPEEKSSTPQTDALVEDADKPHRSPTDAHTSPMGVVSGTIGGPAGGTPTSPRLCEAAVDVSATGGAPKSPPAEARYERSPDGEIAWHRLDYRESMLLTHVTDGQLRDQILAASGLDRATAVQAFDKLLEQGAIRKIEG